MSGSRSAGIAQYEISNFAREGFESRHNLKYWTRQPYFGFGVDAHSMLASAAPDIDAVRFAPADSLEQYMSGHEFAADRGLAPGGFGGEFFPWAAVDAGR